MSRKVIRSPRHARRERRKKAFTLVLLSLFFLAVIGVALYGFSRPVFRIEQIEIIGSSRVPKERVAEAVKEGIAGTYLGFIPKSHSLLYPKSALEAALTKQFPSFSRVSISLKSLAALRVSVREREPQALWCAGTFGCFLLDDGGFVFAEADAGTQHLYYRLEKETTSSPLGTEAIGKERLAALISFLKGLEKLGLSPERVLLGNDQTIEVVLSGSMRLLVREGSYTQALAHLGALLSQGDVFPSAGGNLKVAYIDLRYGNKIYFKPR